jgi:hypothetical protein
VTPVLQTQFVAEHGKGNCVQACVASLLDLPLEAVPAFRDLPACDFEEAIDRFLASRGLRRITVQFAGGFEWGDAVFSTSVWHPVGKCFVFGPPVMLYGKSPRSDTGHAIVGNVWCGRWEMLHDPHPDGRGIVGEPKSIHWIVPRGQP